MKNETYMSADEAVEKGFADEVMTFDEQQAVASIGNGLLPQAVIDDYFANHGNKRKQEIEAMKREIEKRRNFTRNFKSFLFCTKKRRKTICLMKKSKN